MIGTDECGGTRITSVGVTSTTEFRPDYRAIFTECSATVGGATIRLSRSCITQEPLSAKSTGRLSASCRRTSACAGVWPLVCGSKVAQRTAALACVNGELAVRVPDKIWRNELQRFQDRYVAALNQVSRQKVKSIRFVAKD